MNKVGIILLLISISSAFMTNISNASELTILRGNEDYPPDEMHINGKLTGFHIELIQNVAKSIHLNIRFESIPWKRAIQMLKNGEGDALSYASKNASREEFAIFLDDNILTESHYHLIMNSKGNKEILDDVKRKDFSLYTIGIQRGYAYSNSFNEIIFKDKTIFNSVHQMISLIKANRIDLSILTMAEYQAQKESLEFTNIDIISPPLISSASYLAFSKKSKNLKIAKIFSKAMKVYKSSDDYIILKNKYNK
jgi:polar amino acid transport system substrate-binding protein